MFAGNFSNTGAMVNLTGTGTLNAPTFTPSSLCVWRGFGRLEHDQDRHGIQPE